MPPALDSPTPSGTLRARVFTRPLLRRRTWSWLTDLLVFAAVVAVLFTVVKTGESWLGPAMPAAQISVSPRALPGYAANSLVRIGIAYALSLVFALVYGYVAARSARAERVLLPLLDILQSIPVLSFLPGVMLAMVAVFPHRQVGVELGAILLIFTGQAWNIAFSFYASVKGIPRELDEAGRIYRFSRWQRFTELDLPYAAIGLVWNSMMSVAGGWFFLMACEMFVLGPRDFRLPGLGSYLQSAASAGDTRAILWGLAAMVGVIVLLDQLIWRPVIAWTDKFKLEQVESDVAPRSAVLDLLRRSGMVALVYRAAIRPAGERLTQAFASRAGATWQPVASAKPARWKAWLGYALAGVVLAALGYALVRGSLELKKLSWPDAKTIAGGAGITFLRVHAALLLGALWAVPAGVAIGSSPRLARVAQPFAQVAASVPATALFPVVLLLLIRAGGGMSLAALALMLLGTQWYILFNVIAGAMALPSDLKEVAGIFRFGRWDRWRRLILPGIFPYLVTGMLTAAGGAWNASIIAEYFHFRGQIQQTAGLGAVISRATDAGQFHVLMAATIAMAVIVVAMNRLVWQRLYRLAETRFKMET
jgi:NitT/TauT family transport system permease protein